MCTPLKSVFSKWIFGSSYSITNHTVWSLQLFLILCKTAQDLLGCVGPTINSQLIWTEFWGLTLPLQNINIVVLQHFVFGYMLGIIVLHETALLQIAWGFLPGFPGIFLHSFYPLPLQTPQRHIRMLPQPEAVNTLDIYLLYSQVCSHGPYTDFILGGLHHKVC